VVLAELWLEDEGMYNNVMLCGTRMEYDVMLCRKWGENMQEDTNDVIHSVPA